MKLNILLASFAALIVLRCPLSAARLSDSMISVNYEISSNGIVATLLVRGRLNLQDDSLDLGVPAFPGISKLVGLEHDDYKAIIEESSIKVDRISITRANIQIPEYRLRFASRSLPGITLSLSPSAKNNEEFSISIKTIDDSVAARNLGILYFEPCPIGASISVIVRVQIGQGGELASNLQPIDNQGYVPKTNCTTKDPQFLFYRLGSLSAGSN